MDYVNEKGEPDAIKMIVGNKADLERVVSKELPRELIK